MLPQLKRLLNRPADPHRLPHYRPKIDRSRVERDQQATMMAAISDGIIAVDLQGAPLFYNSRFALIIGDNRIERRPIWKLIVDPEILRAFQAALKEGRSATTPAIPFHQVTGLQYFSVSVSPLCAENAQIYGAVGIFHDVSELKRAERMRIDFVANVSHELRTPLTSIKGYVDTLLQDAESGKPIEKSFLERISRNTDRLMDLIHDLLDLSSIESGGVLQRAHVPTAELTSRVLQQMQAALDARKKRVTVRARARTVFADARRIEQILVNLVDNANKYAPIGGEISVRWEPLENGEVELKVSDTGPGIHPEHLPRLFERFYRVDKARSREVGGTGLGLAIVKHIVQRHQGTVAVESAPGQGTTFTCRFPGST